MVHKIFDEETLFATKCPIEKLTLLGSLLDFTSGFKTDQGVSNDKVFARTGNQTREGPVHYPLGCYFTQ